MFWWVVFGVTLVESVLSSMEKKYYGCLVETLGLTFWYQENKLKRWKEYISE
jgi:hypothetical protein